MTDKALEQLIDQNVSRLEKHMKRKPTVVVVASVNSSGISLDFSTGVSFADLFFLKSLIERQLMLALEKDMNMSGDAVTSSMEEIS